MNSERPKWSDTVDRLTITLAVAVVSVWVWLLLTDVAQLITRK